MQPLQTFGTLPGMARSYRDRAELRTHLVDKSVHPLVSDGTVILDGIGFPAVDEPVPIMLTPGYEYRVREFQPETPDTDDADPDGRWLIERRKV